MYENAEKGREGPALGRGLLAGLGGVMLAGILLFLCALAISGDMLSAEKAVPLGRCVLALASLCAGLAAFGKPDGGGRARALTAGAVLLCALLLQALVTDAPALLSLGQLWNLVCVAGGVLAALLLRGRRVRRRRRRKN